MNIGSFFLFLFIFFSVYIGIHYYVYTRIAIGLLLPSNIRICLRLFFLLSALSFPLGELLSRKTSLFCAKPIVYFGSFWLGIISISTAVFFILDLFRIFCRSGNFRYNSVIFSVVIIFLLSSYSIYNVIRPPVIREIKLKTEKSLEKLKGFSIVQLSDLHLRFSKSEKWLDRIVERTNSLNPDLIVITGDLIDADMSNSVGLSESLKKLNSKYGVFAITGNHEFYAGLDKFLNPTKNSNIKVLRNEKITIADSVELVGIDDTAGIRFSGIESDLRNILKNCDSKKFVTLLSHRPEVFDESAKSSVDLQLSGHTHAGQIPPMDLIVFLTFKYPYGLYRKGNSYLYTTSGTGTWGPPMRLFSRCEIVKITIE